MNKPFNKITAVAVPLLRENVDTDAIIPSREMKQVSKKGLGKGLFAGWRYLTGRDSDPSFVLNRPEYGAAEILLSGKNFGCGSSREHAVWALIEYGVKVVIAPSFGSIFYNNSIRNGLLTLVLGEEEIQILADYVMQDPAHNHLMVDLVDQKVTSGLVSFGFDIGAEQKKMLIQGLDAIDVTMNLKPEIDKFEKADRAERPWAHFSK